MTWYVCVIFFSTYFYLFCYTWYIYLLNFIDEHLYFLFQLDNTCGNDPCVHGQCSSINITLSDTGVSKFLTTSHTPGA